MKKRDEDITESDKTEAKRRIEGSIEQSDNGGHGKTPIASLAG